MTNILLQTVSEDLVGLRLDAASAKLFPQYSRSYLTQQISGAKLLLNDQAAKPNLKVKLGDNLKLFLDSRVITDPWVKTENLPLEILYADADLVIINKPHGLVTHPGAGVYDGTLVNRLLYHYPELTSLPRAGLVHRLDKDTTGCLLVARNIISLTSLARAMQAREIKRQYLALVHGKVIGVKTIETYMGRHPRTRTKMTVTNSGRYAITHFEVAERFQDFSLLRVSLQTGRTHQIRVHLAHEKMPIVGDPLYGKNQPALAKWSEELQNNYKTFKRQALHAESLKLIQPSTGQSISVKAPLPHDLMQLLQAIRDYELL